jgi:hypothetical protein
MPHWPWHIIVGAVKQCERLLLRSDATGTFDRAVSTLGAHVVAVAPPPDARPTSSSPESATFRFSCDTKSSDCPSPPAGRAWWFDNLAALAPATMAHVAASLTMKGADHVVIARFLFYYLKCRLAAGAGEEMHRKRKI